MLAVVSPAKKLKFEPADADLPMSTPQMIDRANQMAAIAKKLSMAEIKRLMKLSDNLADLTYRRFQKFSDNPDQGAVKQAVLAFSGDTYIGLDAPGLSRDDLIWSQDHLRILSGLYGVLRPLDAIQPYRLEMGRKLANPAGEDLYDYWGRSVSQKLDEALAGHKSATIINLASKEYFKVIDQSALKADIIDIIFKEERDGVLKILSLFAKRARGAMARYMIENRIEDPEQLKEFTIDGYRFQPELSDGKSFMFTRKKQ